MYEYLDVVPALFPRIKWEYSRIANMRLPRSGYREPYVPIHLNNRSHSKHAAAEKYHVSDNFQQATYPAIEFGSQKNRHRATYGTVALQPQQAARDTAARVHIDNT